MTVAMIDVNVVGDLGVSIADVDMYAANIHPKAVLDLLSVE